MHDRAFVGRRLICPDVGGWREAIAATYYEQDVAPVRGDRFEADMSVLVLNDISLSRLRSPAVRYRRRRAQIATDQAAGHLFTIPLSGELLFEQAGAQSRCAARCVLAEHGDGPYDLVQPDPDELLVLMVPDPVLGMLLPNGRALLGRAVGPAEGIVGLLADLLLSVMARADALLPAHHPALARQILEVLALALTAGDAALDSEQGPVRMAHLRRIRAVIRRRLREPELSPAQIAAESGVSVRYLHRLFASTGTSVGRWVLEQRLAAADAALRNPRQQGSIAQIALGVGFAEHAQFSRHYRRHFGRTPREARALAGEAVPPGSANPGRAARCVSSPAS